MTRSPVGLIAGSGELPVLAAREFRKKDRAVVTCALTSNPSSSLADLSQEFRILSASEFTSVPGYFRDHGVRELLMVGNVDKTELYRGSAEEAGDSLARRLISRLPVKGDRQLLKAAAHLLRLRGLSVLGVDEVLGRYVTPPGHLAGPEMKQKDRSTMSVLTSLATTLSDEEVGQVVSGKNDSVVAVEAAEGTNAMIRRTGELAGEGCVFLKVARSNQDFRFDVPVAGIRTVEQLAEIQASLFVLEAGQTLWLQPEACRRLAESEGITLYGWQRPKTDNGLFSWLWGN